MYSDSLSIDASAQAADSMAAPNPRSRLSERLLEIKLGAVRSAVNTLLATKGYDAMTVDEVAALAGMSKASLYKLYPSKEALAGVAMVAVLDIALQEVDALRARSDLTSLDKLKAITRWAMQTKLEGSMPSLPAQNSSLSEALKSNEEYAERLFNLSMKLGVWVSDAQACGLIRAHFPLEFVLYNLYARACDPVLDAMRDTGNYAQADILDWLIQVHFEGLGGGSSPRP